MTWTKQHIEKLKADGKIRGFEMTTEKYIVPVIGGKRVGKHFKRKSAGLDFIAKNLFYWCQAKCLVLEEEYRFDPAGRKFRFDFCIEDLKLAVEYEGGIFDRNGSHTSFKMVKKDTDKYNLAAQLGWRVLRFNASNYSMLIQELNKCL